MKNQKKRLHLEELNVDSFVTKQLRGGGIGNWFTITIDDGYPSAHRTDCSDCTNCPHSQAPC